MSTSGSGPVPPSSTSFSAGANDTVGIGTEYGAHGDPVNGIIFDTHGGVDQGEEQGHHHRDGSFGMGGGDGGMDTPSGMGSPSMFGMGGEGIGDGDGDGDGSGDGDMTNGDEDGGAAGVGGGDGQQPKVIFRGETRGRHKQDNLPPSRAREVQRAFRARRAAHLARLEDRIDFLERENNTFRARLGLPLQQNTRDLGSGPTGRGKSLAEGGIPMAERVKAKKERERLRREEEAKAKGLALPLGPPVEETNPAYLPGPNVGGKRKASEAVGQAGSEGVVAGGDGIGGPGPNTVKKQKRKVGRPPKAKKVEEQAAPEAEVEPAGSYALDSINHQRDLHQDRHQRPDRLYPDLVPLSARDDRSRRPDEMNQVGPPHAETTTITDDFMRSFLANAASAASAATGPGITSRDVGNPIEQDGMTGYGDQVANGYEDMLERYGLRDESTGLNTPGGQDVIVGQAMEEDEDGRMYGQFLPSAGIELNPGQEPGSRASPYDPTTWNFTGPPTGSTTSADQGNGNGRPGTIPIPIPILNPNPTDLFALAARLSDWRRPTMDRPNPIAGPSSHPNSPGSSSFTRSVHGGPPHEPTSNHNHGWPPGGSGDPFADMPPAQFQAMLAQAAHLVTPDFSMPTPTSGASDGGGIPGGSTARTPVGPSPSEVRTPSSSTGPVRPPSPPSTIPANSPARRKEASKAAAKEEASKWPTPPTTATGPDLLTRLRQCCHLSDTHVAYDPGVLLFASRLCLAVNCVHGGQHPDVDSAKTVDENYMVIEDAWRVLKQHLDPPVPDESPTTLSGFAAGMAKPRGGTGEGQNQIATGRLAAEMVLRAARAKVGGGTASIERWVECAASQGLVIKRELVIGLVGGFSGGSPSVPIPPLIVQVEEDARMPGEGHEGGNAYGQFGDDDEEDGFYPLEPGVGIEADEDI